MPQNTKSEHIKKAAAAEKVHAAEETAVKVKSEKSGSGTKKKTAKVSSEKELKAAGKSKISGKKRKKKNSKKKTPWWCTPVVVVTILILTTAGMLVSKETKAYEEFKSMRQTVSFDGFYPGISIDGVNVGGRQLNEVLLSLRAHEESLRKELNVTLVLNEKVWNIAADNLGYTSNYEEVVRAAYQMGREGTVRQRYDAIEELKQSPEAFAINRGYDVSMLKAITDQIAAESSYAAVDATVSEFDVSRMSFQFTESAEGRHVDGEALYESVLAALNSGTGGQTIVISQQTIKPSVTKAELQKNFGKITEARTNAAHSSSRRLTNIRLALEAINGVCVRPGETFSFNTVVGQRTAERGYKKAGAFVDGMVTEELGGGICQVSTTLFNAAVKADMEVVERQPHSRPVGYVDKGKDAAVSWPSQDFKFTNNTEYPVYIVTSMGETDDRCIISMYGQKLPDGTSIIVESEITETLQPEDPRYIYTTELLTGQKELVEEAREGYKAKAYKIYLDANGKEIRREVLCYSKYAAAGAVYRVGQ